MNNAEETPAWILREESAAIEAEEVTPSHIRKVRFDNTPTGKPLLDKLNATARMTSLNRKIGKVYIPSTMGMM